MQPVSSEKNQSCFASGCSRRVVLRRSRSRNALIATLLPTLCALADAVVSTPAVDPVWAGFQDPPASVRPFVRW
jgi:hypothetical protein